MLGSHIVKDWCALGVICCVFSVLYFFCAYSLCFDLFFFSLFSLYDCIPNFSVHLLISPALGLMSYFFCLSALRAYLRFCANHNQSNRSLFFFLTKKLLFGHSTVFGTFFSLSLKQCLQL